MVKPAAKSKKPKPQRQRRSPEEARSLILEATTKLLVAHGPDTLGLKQVANAAGVSHALVTHYFGTKDALVEEAIAQHSRALQAMMVNKLAEPGALEVENLISLLFESMATPNAGRVAAWLMLSGRIDRDDFFSVKQKGAMRVVDLLMARFAGEGRKVERENVEFAVLVVVTAAHGYALGRKAFLASMGLEASKQRDLWFREKLAQMVRTFA